MQWDRCPVCLSVCNVGVLWPNVWMDQDATWYRGRPRPRPHCVRLDPPPLQRGTAAPTFRPTSIVAKRLPISATAELLFALVVAVFHYDMFCNKSGTVLRRRCHVNGCRNIGKRRGSDGSLVTRQRYVQTRN